MPLLFALVPTVKDLLFLFPCSEASNSTLRNTCKGAHLRWMRSYPQKGFRLILYMRSLTAFCYQLCALQMQTFILKIKRQVTDKFPLKEEHTLKLDFLQKTVLEASMLEVLC